MPTELKRYTISVTPSIEEALDHAKKEHYHNETQNSMIRDLIVLGLESLKMQNAEKDCNNPTTNGKNTT